MISREVYRQCLKNGLTIAFAESMTGGAVAYEMIKNPGASKVTEGGIIAYQISQKIKLLNLDPSLFEAFPVVSPEVAIEMATAVRKLLKTDIGVSVTGNAGPEKQQDSDRLEAWIGIDFKGDIDYYHLELDGLSRHQAIRRTVHFTYQILKEYF